MSTPSSGFVYVSVDASKVLRKIPTFGVAITDLRPAWEWIADDLRGDFRQQFVDEGGAFGAGSRWKRLAKSTQRERARLAPIMGWPITAAHPILFRTGDLMESVVHRWSKDHVEHVLPASLTIGTTFWTASWLHYGTKHIPARRMIGISWKRKSAIIQRLTDYINILIAQKLGGP